MSAFPAPNDDTTAAGAPLAKRATTRAPGEAGSSVSSYQRPGSTSPLFRPGRPSSATSAALPFSTVCTSVSRAPTTSKSPRPGIVSAARPRSSFHPARASRTRLPPCRTYSRSSAAAAAGIISG